MRRNLNILLVLCMLLASLNIPVFAAEDLTRYSQKDIDVINNIIDNNGLQGYEKDAPSTWDFVEYWGSVSGKKVPKDINLKEKNLTGTLDLSGMTALRYLECGKNSLTELNIAGCTTIEALRCASNQISELNLTDLTNLKTLQCNYNNLTSLDVSGLSKLQDLRFFNNINLTTVTGLTDCLNLKILSCSECKLEQLDVSALTNLQELNCNNNSLESLVGLTNKDALREVRCYSNKLEGLDVSGCANLTKLWCSRNSITEITGLDDCIKLANFDCRFNNLSVLKLSTLPSSCVLQCTNNNFTEVTLPNGTVKIGNVLNGTAYISDVQLNQNKVVLKQEPNTGYVFDAWYKNANMTDADKITLNGDVLEVSEDITVYPKFIKTISNEILLTAPVKNVPPQTSIEADDYTAVVEWSPEIPTKAAFEKNTQYTATITITPKQDYTVVGIPENGYILNGATTVENQANSNIVTAVFPKTATDPGSGSVTRYTVTFDTNGGTTIASKRVVRNDIMKEPTAPTRDGYKFIGWYTDEDLKTAYDFSSKVTKNLDLYAAWEKIETEPEPTDKPTDPFDDVDKKDWYYDDVIKAVDRGLFNGTEGRNFAPNDNITRAMFITVLYRADGEPKVDATASFSDVSADSYYANAVIWAKQNGIADGYSDTEFAPNENITREQIAAIMLRYAKYKGYDVSVGESTNILSYTDSDNISEYAIEAMQYAVGSGLMQGKTDATLNLKDNATRAEIAAILNRFIDSNK